MSLKKDQPPAPCTLNHYTVLAKNFGGLALEKQLPTAADLAAARAEIERLRVGHERYETARLMSPRQWADAWKLSISTGKRFDEIVDDMRPFLRPGKVGAT